MPTPRIVVIGAGIGGLVAALDLAVRGAQVTLLERAITPGGKMREVSVGGVAIDAGPTVFTLRPVFEAIFADAGATLADHVGLRPAAILARHAWSARERLDLFADPARSEAAIGAFAGAAAARGFREVCARARQIYRTLERPFLHAPRPTPLGLVRDAGLRGLPDLWRIAPFATLWEALGAHFQDARLRQLFGRYSTYCGASPFHAPATLMLIAHVEQEGVWLVDGGMQRLAEALAALAAARGAVVRYHAEVAGIVRERGRVSGVRLAGGERIAADAVVLNADTAALAAGLFGPDAADAAPPVPPASRSLSAVTWALHAETSGFPLLRHNVFFAADYVAEFDAIVRDRVLPAAPTVYVCAQDRGDSDLAPRGGAERLLCLVNAPPVGDARDFPAEEIDACAERTFSHLARCGLTIHRDAAAMAVTTPADFARLFPGSGGALYGPAMHGSMAAFRRAGSTSRLPGLYLAGGGTHPGAGVPMAALSGRLAAARVLADCASTRR